MANDTLTYSTKRLRATLEKTRQLLASGQVLIRELDGQNIVVAGPVSRVTERRFVAHDDSWTANSELAGK